MSFATINPATGALVTEFPLQSDDQVFAALETADKRYREDWKCRPVAERARIVGRAAQILRAKRDEYAGYLTLEMGKVTRFAYQEVDLVIDILDYYAEHGERFLADESLPEEPGASVIAEPVGVILAIEPWNFPYYQLARVVAPQLVAGNVVMLKHAESVPQCALALANATRYGLGAYVFDSDVEHAKQVASRIEAGMVYINTCFVDSPRLPFGGVKNSGFGRELSELGIGEFLNRKLVRVSTEQAAAK